MAFKHGLSERLDELRFPSPRSPPSESVFPGYTSLSPGHSNFGSGFSRPSADVRGNLQRRFTTDSSKLSSSWNYLSSGPAQMPDHLDLLSSFEKKRQHIEYMRQQKRRFEEDMKLLDMQHEKEKIEMDQLARDLAKAGLSGPVSEPRTPPEHSESLASSIARPGRFASSSVTSSPGFFSAFAPSSQVTSPQALSQPNHQTVDRFAGHSLPGSRRNSEKEEIAIDSGPFRPGPSLHRYSLPSNNFSTTSRQSSTMPGYKPSSGVDSFAATKHLFPSEDHHLQVLRDDERLSTPDIKGYIKMTEPSDDPYPALTRETGSNLLATSAEPREFVMTRANPSGESFAHHSRHRLSHQSMPSMPQDFIGNMRFDMTTTSPPGDRSSVAHARHISLEGGGANVPYPIGQSSPAALAALSSPRPAAPQGSYSTNDLPTVKGGFDAPVIPRKRTLESFYSPGHQGHSATVGSQAAKNLKSETSNDHMSAPTTLQASAVPFGPQLTAVVPGHGMAQAMVPAGLGFTPMFGYGQYTAQPMQSTNQLAAFGQTAAYGAYPGQIYAPTTYRYNDTVTRAVPASRRQLDSDAGQATRYGNYPLEHYEGELYNLCKDQHGCRYLQRKLEERNPEHVQLIFNETYMHVTELMTDPFGNYLCQKLLEYSNDDQRTALINNAAPQLVRIALNQHGTRALQKMIEFISTPQQTQTVIAALKDHVVDLVKDLNGNHVIQKCLNRLNAEEAEFIYEAVGTHCVVVGTHRHGCCVLQRCIDHASGEQKARLIAQVTAHSFTLVQDPFGNYVVQYILDLAEPCFTTPLCRVFANNIPELSKQKFSSNVIEKCLRTADSDTRRAMIEEILSGNELEAMLRDSFANYVVQTAMDFSDAETRQCIVDAIRPILPSIRQTPHGRRIAGKILAAEGSGRSSTQGSGQVTPNEVTPSAQAANMASRHFSGYAAANPTGAPQMAAGTAAAGGHGYAPAAPEATHGGTVERTAGLGAPLPNVSGRSSSNQMYAAYY
ncbi:hypothetical protein N7539_002138 [Penicillium diatomitis]|uniref:PUM-HD domain-containing protein n=1 Tax=Penicillium diatomitis TaxID=2819901 RepID=A0A9W9XI31_9EURO|nr:uncharacterized protein N7539_002138 [Penicillium diatomitis]KAJ5493392.1 hypothetical protein N7539_002138 [Penicillium diatomitis]